MDARAKKLSKFVDAKLVPTLLAAGFDTPRKIKAASDSQLRALPGIGDVKIQAMRERLGPGR